MPIEDVCLVSWVSMHFSVFFQGSHPTTVFPERLDKGPESLLLTWSVVCFWVSKVNNVFPMLPICLAFSSLYLGFHLSVMGDILGTVGCSLSLEEFISFSLQCLGMFIYPLLWTWVPRSSFWGMYSDSAGNDRLIVLGTLTLCLWALVLV